ncbi:uncharacterized protein LOC115376234 [Myripristis murdjan]|uniref:uncharacterized protein LOC115376234 n=1 Tax=Myripristis murdjan TaxID=586833 RepID=UPI001175F1BE|nr:uncharacterized protein LOC115376234 [Myripristis murdjan]
MDFDGHRRHLEESMSEDGNRIGRSVSEELRQAGRSASPAGHQGPDTPPASACSSTQQPLFHLNLGPRQTAGVTDFIHELNKQQSGSSRSCSSSGSLGRTPHSLADSILLPAGDEDVIVTTVLSEEWRKPKDEDGRSLRSVKGEVVDSSPKKLKSSAKKGGATLQPSDITDYLLKVEDTLRILSELLETQSDLLLKTTFANQPQNTLPTPCPSVSTLGPYRTPSSIFTRPSSSAFHTSQFWHPSSCYCQVHGPTGCHPGAMCVAQAAHTCHCCCRWVPGPHASVCSCGPHKKEVQVLAAHRAKEEQLRLYLVCYQANQEAMRSLCCLQRVVSALAAQCQRAQDDRQGPCTVSPSLQSLQCQVDSITHLSHLSNCCMAQQQEELEAVVSQRPTNSPSSNDGFLLRQPYSAKVKNSCRCCQLPDD